MEENKKSNSKILIIFLVLIILGLVGYIAYDKFVVKDSNEPVEEEKEEEKEEELSLDDSRFNDIYEKVSSIAKHKDVPNLSSLTEKDYPSIVFRDLSSTDFIKIDEKTEWGDNYYTIKYDAVDKIIKKYFGSDFKYNPDGFVDASLAITGIDTPKDSVGSGLTIISYDSQSKLYKVRFSGIGGTSIDLAKLIDEEKSKAVLKGDVITLTTSVIYITPTSNFDKEEVRYDVYSDREKTKSLLSKTYSFSEAKNITIKPTDFEDCGHLVYTFKYDDTLDSYYFVSVVTKEKE
ncbi:MAG: hypothetical protein IJI43_02900 [Bacilli bacterium]|nr:hypothetical protein [Bacilli bacterium]